MRATLRIGDGNPMMSDGHCQGSPVFQGCSLALRAADEAQARPWFDALGEGGQVLSVARCPEHR